MALCQEFWIRSKDDRSPRRRPVIGKDQSVGGSSSLLSMRIEPVLPLRSAARKQSDIRVVIGRVAS